MKRVRPLLIGAAAVLLLLAVAVAVAFNARCQTWAARRALAAYPALGVTIGSVSAGLGRVELRDVRVETRGAVLTVPALAANLPLVSAGLGHRLLVSRLVGKDWTLDLTSVDIPREWTAWLPVDARRGNRPAHAGEDFAVLPAALAAEPAALTSTVALFQGILSQLQLPFDLALDGVNLAGEVILPGARGRARVTITGGGLAAGREGKFEVAGTAMLNAASVSTLEAWAAVTAAMDTPRTFRRLGAKASATASGTSFPRGVKLGAELSAQRAATGENYVLTLTNEQKQLLAVQADFPANVRKLDGMWKLEVCDADLAPFTLGRALPKFEARGDGRFDVDAGFAEIRAAGRLTTTAQNLAVLQFPVVGAIPGLAALGAVRLAADFDFAQLGNTTRVDRLNVTVAGAQPVATIQSLQTFAFNRKTGALSVADPTRELIGIVLHGVPLVWAQPFLKDFTVTGGDVRGELVAAARDGGFAVRATTPLVAHGLSVTRAGRTLLRGVDVSLAVSAAYAPLGWQIEIAPLVAKTSAGTLATVEAKAGQLAGGYQPIKTAGKFSVDLPSALAQFAAGGWMQLTRGEAAGEFAASLGASREIQAKLSLTKLERASQLAAEKLPAVSAELRADFAAGGQIAFNIPVLIECDGRTSDLALIGTMAPGKDGLAITARAASTLFVVEDVKVLAAPLAGSTAAAGAVQGAVTPPVVRETAPPWAGFSGQLVLALKKVVYSDKFQASDLTGTLRLGAIAAWVEGVHAGLGENSEANVSGSVTFDAESATPYALAADITVNDFDPARLFKAMNPGQPATIEGKFSVASKLAGHAAHLADLAAAAHGELQLTSKGGVFRGLPVNVAARNETVGKLASIIAMGGSALDALKGRKDDSDITSTAKAVAEVSKLLAAIQYDQLGVVVSRDASLNTVLKDFTLIAPEVRLNGGGKTTHQAGAALLDESLAMEFKLRARGHTAEVLKYLGKLEAPLDELGYAACTLPLKIGGTLGKPDTTELDNALASLALEKGGVKDKASELLNKLLGGGK